MASASSIERRPRTPTTVPCMPPIPPIRRIQRSCCHRPRAIADRASSGGSRFAEADAPVLQAFAGGVVVVPGFDAESGRRLLGWVAGWGGRCVGFERATVVVGELDAVGLVGVAADAQAAVVVSSVVVAAEGDEVVGVGGAA